MTSSPINYTLKRNSRSMSLRLAIKNGQVIVSSPPLIPKFLIDKFVQSHAAWIKKHLAAGEGRVKINERAVQVFGQKYQLTFVYDEKLPLGISTRNKTLFFNDTHYHLAPKPAGAPPNAAEKKRLDTWLQQTAKKYIIPRVRTLAATMKVPKEIKRITLRNQDSRWGSCSSLGGLNFNYRLVHFKPATIDYVIIHELAHLTHLNHGQGFWALVAKYDGNYKLHRQELKH